jgi:putative heme-binding domain-containing protein
LSNDEDVQVRRACIIALRHLRSPESPQLWASLAAKYNGNDRWYLEALGIGADGQWDAFFQAWLTLVKDPLQSAATKDIVWRARTEKAVPYIARLAGNNQEPLKDRLRYFRAFDFNTGPAKSSLLLAMIAGNKSDDITLNKLVLHHLDIATVSHSVVAQHALNNVLQSVAGTNEYLDLINRYELHTENDKLLQLAIDSSKKSLGANAARTLLKLGGENMAWKVINGADTARVNRMLVSLGRVGNSQAIDMMQKVISGKSYLPQVKQTAAANLGRSGTGEDRVLELLKAKKVPADLIPLIVQSVSGAWRKAVRDEAARYLPGSAQTAALKLPDIKTINALKGNALTGKIVFSKFCFTCHQVNKEGNDFGPPLSEIGSKYPKEGLLTSILKPSEGIGFGYEGWQMELKDGSSIVGIIASKTEDEIELKLAGGNKRTIKQSEIQSRKQLDISLMPEGLYQQMETQQLADLLEYLSSLKKK